MPYLQVVSQGKYLTRSLALAVPARIEGHPGYMAVWGDNPSLVRTILYEERDKVYLTDEKGFILTSLSTPDQKIVYVFSSNPNVTPVALSSILGVPGSYFREWSPIWANMKTDVATRSGLIWPSNSWQESWQYALVQQYPVAFKDESSGNWISVVDAFGGEARVSAALAWRVNPATFHLVQKKEIAPLMYTPTGGNTNQIQGEALLRWGLRYTGFAVSDANEVINVGEGRNLWVKSWDVDDANRLLFSVDPARAIYFDVSGRDTQIHTPQSPYRYSFSYLNRHLTKGGYWQVRIWPSPGVTGGVEFYNGNPQIDVSFNIIDPSLSDINKYLLGQGIYVNLYTHVGTLSSMWNPENITPNLPHGGGTCNTNAWDGVSSSCLGEYIPYVAQVGELQCTSLDDFSNDIHCQLWASQRKGPQLDTLLSSLCKNTTPGDKYQNVCGCYYPESVYYKAIQDRYSSATKLGTIAGTLVADAIRTTNLLQCSSDLCTGQEGTFSPSVFYRDGRKCDVCIQSYINDLTGATIHPGANISLEQVCAHVDVTYTWSDLITRLEGLGAYKIIPQGFEGIYKHVIINQDGTAIKLITSTPLGKQVLSKLTLLSLLPKDNQGNIILTREKWNTNTTRYTNEILTFFLQARES